LLLGEVPRPTETPLQYVYADGKPVSVIVPIELWHEQPGRPPVGKPAVEAPFEEELLVDVVCKARVRPHAALSPADITSVLDWEPLEAPDLRAHRPDEVCWGGRRIKLRRRIVCNVSREDGLVVIQYDPLGIRAYAESREFAIRDFAEEFMALWEEYALVPDEELTPDAVGLKRRLLALVEVEGNDREWPIETSAEARDLPMDTAKAEIAAYVSSNPGCGYFDLSSKLGLPLDQVGNVLTEMSARSQIRVEAAT